MLRVTTATCPLFPGTRHVGQVRGWFSGWGGEQAAPRVAATWTGSSGEALPTAPHPSPPAPKHAPQPSGTPGAGGGVQPLSVLAVLLSLHRIMGVDGPRRSPPQVWAVLTASGRRVYAICFLWPRRRHTQCLFRPLCFGVIPSGARGPCSSGGRPISASVGLPLVFSPPSSEWL